MRKFFAMLVGTAIFLLAGCSGAATPVHQVSLGQYKMDVPDTLKTVESSTKLPEGMQLFRAEKERIFLQTMIVKDSKIQMDENTLANEVKKDSYLKAGAASVIPIDGIGKAYSLMVKDSSTGMEYEYFKLKAGEEVISVIYAAEGALGEKHQKEALAIIKSLRK